MEESHGDEYESYRRQTPFLFQFQMVKKYYQGTILNLYSKEHPKKERFWALHHFTQLFSSFFHFSGLILAQQEVKTLPPPSVTQNKRLTHC